MLARVAGLLWPSTILQGNSHHLFRCRSVEGQGSGLMSGDCAAPARPAATYSRHCASAIIVWVMKSARPAAHCPALPASRLGPSRPPTGPPGQGLMAKFDTQTAIQKVSILMQKCLYP